jgi:predicted RecB family nuclease
VSPPAFRSTRLSKSRFVAGWQCEKLLWWMVHESNAPELQPDKVLQDLFDQGRHVGELARRRFPGGTLIDVPHDAYAERLAATRTALAADAPAIYEASFEAGGVFVSVDVLERNDSGWTLIEVKSGSSVKDEAISDAAIQTWVLRESGLDISRVEVMHLNKEYRHPDLGELLVRSDVTALVAALLPQVPGLVTELKAVLDGAVPDKKLGQQCHDPRDCAFVERCWPADPDHIRTLYNVGLKTAVSYMASGVHSVWDIHPGQKLPDAARRQLKALKERRLIVEPTLADALIPFESPLGYLDFETVARAVPVWDGLAPWGAAVAQFSYHEEQPGGTLSHVGWLAEGPGDPRREVAEAMLAATAGARRIVTYSAYEKTRIKELKTLLPDLAGPIDELLDKLVDLLPVVRNHVYHPEFKGSFSLKSVLTPIVPDLTYNDLVIVDGRLASVEIARLLFVAHRIPAHERDRLRQDLLDYCERDTLATVRLMARLRELSVSPESPSHPASPS